MIEFHPVARNSPLEDIRSITKPVEKLLIKSLNSVCTQ